MRKIFLFTILTLVLGTLNLFAQRGGASQSEILTVRVASPLPRESPWGRSLDRIAAEWSRVTNGQVQLRVLHNGIEGDEEQMLQSLRSNHIQAAVLTTFGLSVINPSVMTLSAPFLIRTDAELDAVMREVQTDLEAGINNEHYFLISWSRSGFANIFSRDPVLTPNDLRNQRISSSPEAATINTVFVNMGFQVVTTPLTEIGNRVASGAVQAVYITPSAAAPFQLQTRLRHMLSINLGPIMGGMIINQTTWRRIGELNPRYQQEIMNVTRQISRELDQSMPRLTNEAISAMTRTGLTVNRPSAAQEQLWYNEIERTVPGLLGTSYDRELYQRITAILTRVRGGR